MQNTLRNALDVRASRVVTVALLAAAAFAAIALAGCVVPGRHGQPVLLVPPLPSLVVLGDEPYYDYGGYQYYYRDDRWYYSRQRGGPWVELPRDHYPREVQVRGRGRGEHPGRGEERGRGHEKGRGRGHDKDND